MRIERGVFLERVTSAYVTGVLIGMLIGAAAFALGMFLAAGVPVSRLTPPRAGVHAP